jgi:hypothetical protein
MTISKRVLDVLQIMVEIALKNTVSTLSCNVDSGSHLKGTWRFTIKDPATGEETVINDLLEDPLSILVQDGYIERIPGDTYHLLPKAFQAFGH